jgi:hypothetical protein
MVQIQILHGLSEILCEAKKIPNTNSRRRLRWSKRNEKKAITEQT